MMFISTIEPLSPQISKTTKTRIVQGKTSCAVTLPGLNIKYPQSGEILLLILSVLDGEKEVLMAFNLGEKKKPRVIFFLCKSALKK